MPAIKTDLEWTPYDCWVDCMNHPCRNGCPESTLNSEARWNLLSLLKTASDLEEFEILLQIYLESLMSAE